MTKVIKKLRLGKNQKWLGVCSGIANYFGLDATLVRVVWLISTVFSGFFPGLVLYILVAWVMSDNA